jgi:hypothetical protein
MGIGTGQVRPGPTSPPLTGDERRCGRADGVAAEYRGRANAGVSTQPAPSLGFADLEMHRDQMSINRGGKEKIGHRNTERLLGLEDRPEGGREGLTRHCPAEQ